ncbi:DUF3426 domain-containing protein [Parvibaculum sp.]|uniref:DUF3426 domain-containing protein n=1 Tax=Parvibaculum sp. TaxID=2024848 RepID=UPI00320F95F1
MIITCPACSARYPVDAAAFAPSGRKVRCAKCGHSWHQAPPTDLPRKGEEPAAAPAPQPEPEPAREIVSAPEPVIPFEAPATPIFKKPAPAEAEPSAPEDDIGFAETGESQLGNGGKLRHFVNRAASSRRGRVFSAIGWVLLIAFVGSTLFGGWHYRKDIAALWPATTKIYSAVDKPMNLRGLEFRGVGYERQTENGLPVLAVKGEVVNISDERRAVPRLRVGLLDGKQHELYHWTFALSEADLAPKQAVPFVTRLSSPPVEVRDLELRFVQKGEEAEPASPPTTPNP